MVPPPLRAALADLNPPLDDRSTETLAALWRLLKEWDRAGLTGFGSDEDLAFGYFREALDLRPLLPPSGPFLDIGSGGGTPALPLAISGAGNWTLLEPRRVASAFLELAAGTLLPDSGTTVERARLAEWLRDRDPDSLPFRAATLRAVRLSRSEWTGLAKALPPGAVVVWPTSAAGRQRAGIPEGAFEERTVSASRGIVWLGTVPAAMFHGKHRAGEP